MSSQFAGKTPEELRALMSERCRDVAELSLLLEAMVPKPEPKRARMIEACIMEACPAANESPISRRKLAVRAGYAYTPYFRSAVTALVEAKLLVETTKGVRKTGRGEK